MEKRNVITMIKDFFIKPKVEPPKMPAAKDVILSKVNFYKLREVFKESNNREATSVLPDGSFLHFFKYPTNNPYCHVFGYLIDKVGNTINLELIDGDSFGSYESIYKAAYENPEAHTLHDYIEQKNGEQNGLIENTLDKTVEKQEPSRILMRDGHMLEFVPVTVEASDYTYKTANINLLDKDGSFITPLFYEQVPEHGSINDLITVGNVKDVQRMFDCAQIGRSSLDDYIAEKLSTSNRQPNTPASEFKDTDILI